MTKLTPSSSYSIALRIRLLNQPGALARVTQAIAEVGGSLSQIDLIHQSAAETVREICVDAVSSEHAQQIYAAVASLANVKVERVVDRTFELHRGGKAAGGGQKPPGERRRSGHGLHAGGGAGFPRNCCQPRRGL